MTVSQYLPYLQPSSVERYIADVAAAPEDVLGRRKFGRSTANKAQRFVADVRSRAEVVPEAPEPWLVETRDPEDGDLVALAHEAGVDALVSGDVHLTDLVDLMLRL